MVLKENFITSGFGTHNIYTLNQWEYENHISALKMEVLPHN